ncbi:MAG: helix-turn-helix transcriptional regulator [bacterium]
MPQTPSYQVFLWPGRGLVLSSTIVATLHRHAALQLTLGLDGPFRVRPRGGSWRSTEVALLVSGAPHELDGQGRVQANFYVEPESQLGRELAAKFLGSNALGLPPAEAFAKQRRGLLALSRRKGTAEEAWAVYKAVTGNLRGVELPGPAADERVVKALRIFRGLEDKHISAGDLAKQVFLSESRLSHLFSEQLGMPIKRYLLWLKVVAACERVNSDDNITQAAQTAGFTDGAHLTHSLRHLIGVSPRTLFNNRSFVRIVTAPDPRAL